MSERLDQEAARVRTQQDAAALSPQESVAERERLDAAIASSGPAPITWLAGGVSLAAVAAGLLLAIAPWSAETGLWRGAQGPLPECVSFSDTVLTVGEACAVAELRRGPDRVTASRGTRVLETDLGPRLSAGRLTISVTPRTRQSPFELWVSEGRIRVIGTRFSVSQGQTGGELEVFSGRVEFVWSNGEVDPVGAGESLRWPRETTAAEEAPDEGESPVDKKTTPEPRRGLGGRTTPSRPVEPEAPEIEAEPVLDITGLMRELTILRGRGDYRAAAGLLERALAHPAITPRQTERLAFELGLILDRIGDQGTACRHWRGFARRFAEGERGRHAAERVATCPKQ